MKYHSTPYTLPLKDFYEISETGNYEKLCVWPLALLKGVDFEEVFNDIVSEYFKLRGITKVEDDFNKRKYLSQLLATYNGISAMLTYLWYKVEWNYIEMLKSMGYSIETTKTRAEYVASIDVIRSQSQSLLTQMTVLSEELTKKDGKEVTWSYEIHVAHLASEGITIDENTTLAQSAAHESVIRRKNTKGHGNSR